MFQDNAFSDFEPSVTSAGNASMGAAGGASQTHDWDSMFDSLDKPAASSQANGAGAFPQPSTANGSAGGLETPSKPPMARAVSTGTEHDDPILKRLTAMGYPREESLAALEKFDYNLDKVDSSNREG
jgi:epidermal growth factor receptor substrate 15